MTPSGSAHHRAAIFAGGAPSDVAPGGTTDLIDRLVDEHRCIRAALDAVRDADVDERRASLRGLVRAIVQHEVSEEVVVYPAARRLGVTGQLVLDARLAEQAALDRSLDRLRRLDVASPDFDELLREVELQVAVHSRYEEQTVLEPLRSAIAGPRLAQLGEAYARTKVAAPVHPYPPEDGSPIRRDLAGPRARLLEVLRRIRNHAGRRS